MLARGLAWATAPHRRYAHLDLVFHARDLPAALNDAKDSAAGMVAAVEALLPPPADHVNHFYWVSAINDLMQWYVREGKDIVWPPEIDTQLLGKSRPPERNVPAGDGPFAEPHDWDPAAADRRLVRGILRDATADDGPALLICRASSRLALALGEDSRFDTVELHALAAGILPSQLAARRYRHILCHAEARLARYAPSAVATALPLAAQDATITVLLEDLSGADELAPAIAPVAANLLSLAGGGFMADAQFVGGALRRKLRRRERKYRRWIGARIRSRGFLFLLGWIGLAGVSLRAIIANRRQPDPLQACPAHCSTVALIFRRTDPALDRVTGDMMPLSPEAVQPRARAEGTVAMQGSSRDVRSPEDNAARGLPRVAQIDASCAVCGASRLEEFSAFATLPRVTSDCKPWPPGGHLCCCSACGAIQKRADAAWLAEAQQIYDAYEIYHLSGGAEQMIFASDENPEPRSQTLIEFAASAASLGRTGRLIDIGCGNGAALAKMASALPDWDLYGHELGSGAEVFLRSLPRFRGLFTGDLGSVPGQYDFISMIHSLEHIPDPLAALRTVRRMLADGGRLLVEVPDLATSPFDLVVADHRTHFTTATLKDLAARAGLKAEILSDHVLPKEITLIARAQADTAPVASDAASQAGAAQRAVRWLQQVLAHAEDVARQQPFGIFGTAIGGMWLFGAIRERVQFFVDEDPARIGRTYEGRPIYSPAQVPDGSTVYAPLAPPLANRVVARLNQNHSARFVAPPAQPQL
jgi:SAM-dependent methyltransferase